VYPRPLGTLPQTVAYDQALATCAAQPATDPCWQSLILPPAPASAPPNAQTVLYTAPAVNATAQAGSGMTIGLVVVLGALAWWGLAKGGGKGRNW
jgi:hypothetical protein